jgi:hypothetical protein
MKSLLYLFCVLMLTGTAMSQDDAYTILKEYRCNPYQVRLVRVRLAETTEVKPPNTPPSYGKYYEVLKQDSIIETCIYKEGDCYIQFVEYKRVQGLLEVDSGVMIDLCKLTVKKKVPPVFPWINQPVDSITMYPLDSMYLRPDGTPELLVANYHQLQPQKLSEQQVQQIQLLYQHARPITFETDGKPMTNQSFLLTFYSGQEQHRLMIRYDLFYADRWWYHINYANYTVNFAKEMWDKHVATTGIRW